MYCTFSKSDGAINKKHQYSLVTDIKIFNGYSFQFWEEEESHFQIN